MTSDISKYATSALASYSSLIIVIFGTRGAKFLPKKIDIPLCDFTAACFYAAADCGLADVPTPSCVF